MRAHRFTKLLLSTALATSMLAGVATSAQATPHSTKRETYTTVLSPAAIFAGADGTDDYAKYGGCQLVAAQLSCWAKPDAGGNNDPRPLWASVTFAVPAKVAARAVPGSLKMQVTATFTNLSGRVDWDYGGSGAHLAYAHLPRKKVKVPKFVTLNGSFTANGRMTPTVDFGFTAGARATFGQVLVTYSYLSARS